MKTRATPSAAASPAPALVRAMLLACTLSAATAAAAGNSARPAPAGHPALDLRVGDISHFVNPDLLATPVEEAIEEVVVNGRRPEPLPEQRVLPQGLGAYLYAATHPLQAWRMFLPDPNYEIPLRTADDARESPGQYRARILAPGRIFD